MGGASLSSLPEFAAKWPREHLIQVAKGRDPEALSVYDQTRWVATRNDLTKQQTLDAVCGCIRRMIDERPRHRVSLFTKYDVEEYNSGNRVVPRLLAGGQFTREQEGRYWPIGSRGVEGVMEHLAPRETLDFALRRVEEQVNAFLQRNRDKKVTSFTVMYQPLSAAGAKCAEWEQGKQARIFVILAWEKLDVPAPIWLDRRFHLVAYPPPGKNDSRPFNVQAATEALNGFIAAEPTRQVVGMTAMHRKEVRPGDFDGIKKDHFLFGLMTEQNYKDPSAVVQKVVNSVGYGGPGVFWERLRWMEKEPNRVLAAHSDWSVRAITNQFFYGELPEVGGHMGARASNFILFEKPADRSARPYGKRREFRVWVQANETEIRNGSREYWSGDDYDRAIEGRVALLVKHQRGARVLHNKVQHDWGQYIDGDSPTDRVIGAMLLEEA